MAELASQVAEAPPTSAALETPPDESVPGAEAFEHADAQRRFRTVTSVEELERALTYPWDKWTVFLHPAQRASVEKEYGGPARVAGSAGTGKTIVALHRAVSLARAHREARVLLTTFSETLANALRTRLRRLIGNEPRIAERLDVHAVDAIARRLYELNMGRPEIATREAVRDLLKEAATQVEGQRFSLHFLATEWGEVVDAWQLDAREAYRDVARLGRKTRLPEKQREDRRGTISAFNGPEPAVRVVDSPQAERDAVARWLAGRMVEGVQPHEAAVFVRSEGQMARARAAVAEAGLSYKELDDKVETTSGCVSISTMHLAKGLEFRAVAVMACDDGVVPLQERIEAVADDSDLEEVYDTERHLLYVACTRARDCLLVTGVAPASEFLGDLDAACIPDAVALHTT
jgi:superfamily I DNA/RNA helicase